MYKSLKDIIRANQAWATKSGRVSFFDDGAMRFFSSKLNDKIYGGRFFISSEQYLATMAGKQDYKFSDGPRTFTNKVCYENGQIETVGPIHKYLSLEEAESALDVVVSLQDKYLVSDFHGNQAIYMLACVEPTHTKHLNKLSEYFYKPLSFHEMMPEICVWTFTEDKLGPAEFYLTTQGFSNGAKGL